jgi:hypothetical protein
MEIRILNTICQIALKTGNCKHLMLSNFNLQIPESISISTCYYLLLFRFQNEKKKVSESVFIGAAVLLSISLTATFRNKNLCNPNNNCFMLNNKHFNPNNNCFMLNNKHFNSNNNCFVLNNEHFNSNNVCFVLNNEHFNSNNACFMLNNEHFNSNNVCFMLNNNKSDNKKSPFPQERAFYILSIMS